MSRFSRDSPSLKSPGVPVSQPKSPDLAFGQPMWSDNRRILGQNVQALIMSKSQSIPAFPAVIFTRK